jgi:hypothetical protein
MNNKWYIEADIDFLLFPKASEALNEKFKDAKRKWIAKIRDSKIPEWWKRAMKLDGGGIHKRKFYGGYKLYYTNSGKYDYMEVIEKGRPRYDMKPALLRRGKMGKNGMYRIVPINKGGVKFRAVNALSRGWFYPEIPKTDAYKSIKEDIQGYIESDEFQGLYANELMQGKSNNYTSQNNYISDSNTADNAGKIQPIEDYNLESQIDRAIRDIFK